MINICIIKQIKTNYPAVFEDSAHCISHSLKKIGRNNIITYNTIDPSIPNIVLGVGAGNTVPIHEFREIARPDKTIIFNMEQTGSDSQFINNDYLQLLSEYTILDYNEANINTTSKITKNRIRGLEFPLAPFFDLPTNTLKQPEIIYDYGFYGKINQDRAEKISQLQEAGLKIKIISGSYGQFLTDSIMDCKAILNLHYYDTHIFEAARALRPTAIGIPIISEKSILPKTVNWKESGIYFTEGELCKNALDIINNKDQLIQLSRNSITFTKNEKWIENTDRITKIMLEELKNS